MVSSRSASVAAEPCQGDAGSALRRVLGGIAGCQRLADAYTAGTTRVTFEGRTVEYRSLAEISQALTAGYAAENPAQRRPCITLARFTRDAG